MNSKDDFKRNSKQLILQVALKEFSAHGLAGARIDQIAKLSGLNKAMIYYHFSSKEKLYDAVIESEIQKIITKFDSGMNESGSFEEILVRLSGFYQQVFTAEVGIGHIILRELVSGGHRVPEIFARAVARKNLPARLIQHIREGQSSGDYRSIDPRLAMISFIGMNLFYLFNKPMVDKIWEIEDDRKFMEKRPAEMVDLFLRGLQSR